MISEHFAQAGPATRRIGAITIDGLAHDVSVRIAFDGIEFVGHTGFAVSGSGQPPVYDYGAIPGATSDQVVAAALGFSEDDLLKRFHRAHAERRRFIPLRRSVEEILAKVKYMNRIAISMRGGVLDAAAAGEELELVTEQIQEIVSRLKDVAAGPWRT